MARRNRKKRVEGIVSPAAPYAASAVLVVALALGYLGLQARCGEVGRQIKELETQRKSLNRILLDEESRWTCIKAPSNLNRALARHGAKMGWPRPDQVVRFPDATLQESEYSLQGTVASYVRNDRKVLNE